MNTRAHTCLALLTLSAAVACSTERPLDGAYQESTFTSEAIGFENVVPGDGNLDVLASTIKGKMGAVAVDHDATATGFDDVGITTVYNNVDVAAGGAAMTIVDIMGGIAHADFVPGARLTYPASSLADVDEGGTFVSVIGCSGPTSGAWDFDSGADSVVVDVSEGHTPEHVIVTYTAQFSGIETNIVTGAFEVAR